MPPRSVPRLNWFTCSPSFVDRGEASRPSAQARGDRPVLDASAYAYDYLFDQDPVLAEGRGLSDPRFRLAMEIYNAGVDRLIRAASRPRDKSSRRMAKRFPSRFTAANNHCGLCSSDSPWQTTDIHKILLASDFEVAGINRDLSQYGIGVPVIAVRETGNKKGERSPLGAVLSDGDGLSTDRVFGAQLAAQRPQRRHHQAARVHPVAVRSCRGSLCRRQAQYARPRNRLDNTAGLYVVADGPGSLSLDRLAAAGTGP